MLPTPEYLASILHYDPETGALTWKARPVAHFKNARVCNMRNARFAGKVATRQDSHGHIQIRIDGVLYMAHRVAWAIATGSWPDGEIDHVNHKRSDNRFENMRDVPPGDNARNASMRSDNSSGVTGVYWNDRLGKWTASIRTNGQLSHLGVFETIEAATSARAAAQNSLGFHPNHGSAAA